MPTGVEARPNMAEARPIMAGVAWPAPNNWETLLPEIPPLRRKLRVALPCVGIDGCGTALKHMKVRITGCNIYDLDANYATHLRSHVQQDGYETMALGKNDG